MKLTKNNVKVISYLCHPSVLNRLCNKIYLLSKSFSDGNSTSAYTSIVSKNNILYLMEACEKFICFSALYEHKLNVKKYNNKNIINIFETNNNCVLVLLDTITSIVRKSKV